MNARRNPLLILFVLLALVSACEKNASSEDIGESSKSNGTHTEAVAETPVAPVSEEDEAKAAETALKEKETGVADLREFVDEIAPEPEIPVSPASPGSESASSDIEAKPETEAAGNKETESVTDVQENPIVMVALADGGLQTVNPQTGSTLDILFEVDQDIAISTVSTAFGEPTETVDTSECPAGPLKITTWPNGFSINTLDETFVGWHVRPNSGSENLTTISGVGIGTSVKNLQETYEVEIFDSSLGTEFNVGKMSGLLSSDKADGEITNLWAGTNCIFR